jgi:glycosyltransferase involved in cell wall biosynthesis
MSTGRPVIASRIGALTELVADGETGLLVEPGDPLALQRAIEQLLANPDLRKCMGQAALHRVAEFQTETVIPRIEQVYQAILQS